MGLHYLAVLQHLPWSYEGRKTQLVTVLQQVATLKPKMIYVSELFLSL